MSYSLANVEGRAALVVDGRWYDLESVSGGELGPDPMAALATPERLAALTAELDQHQAGGSLDPERLGPPVPRPRNEYAIGLNYQAHADEGGMDVPANPLVFTIPFMPGRPHRRDRDGQRCRGLRGRAGGGDRPRRARTLNPATPGITSSG